MRLTRRWVVLAVVAALLAACTEAVSIGDQSGGVATLGNAAVFCRAWPDARTKLLGVVTGDRQIQYDQDDQALARLFADVDATVPAGVRTEWDRAYETFTAVSDLLFTTQYLPEAIRSEHLAMAFGDTGPEAAVADAEAAVAAIDDWAVTACGDFCSRWGELDRVLQIPDRTNPGELVQHIDRDETALAAGDRLVPDEIAGYWRIAAGYQRGYFDLARSLDFDPGPVGEGEEGAARFAEAVGLPWEDAHQAVDMAKEQIGRWVQANCDAATTPGAPGGPGSLTVRITPHEHLTGRGLLLALLPAGTDFAAVRSPEQYLASSCPETHESPEEWQEWLAESAPAATEAGMSPEEFVMAEFAEHFSQPLRSLRAEGEYFEHSVCSLVPHESGAALIPGGTYELFVGAYHGDPGSYGLYLAAPEFCLQFPVTVAGDTVVDLPVLEPCDLEPLGSPEEIARRTPAPYQAGGTLRVEVATALQPEGFDYCNLNGVLLPAGTTLNDLGRGDAWPSGLFNFSRWRPSDVEGADDRWARAPGLVPVLRMPLSGPRAIPLSPYLRPDGPWDTRFPDPVPLAAGSYDLRIEESCGKEVGGEGTEQLRCAFVTVEVDGATVVEMPELGACS